MPDEKTKKSDPEAAAQPVPEGKLSEQDLAWVSGKLSDEALEGLAGADGIPGEAGWPPPGEAA